MYLEVEVEGVLQVEARGEALVLLHEVCEGEVPVGRVPLREEHRVVETDVRPARHAPGEVLLSISAITLALHPPEVSHEEVKLGGHRQLRAELVQEECGGHDGAAGGG